jgi:hypothetical protein
LTTAEWEGVKMRLAIRRQKPQADASAFEFERRASQTTTGTPGPLTEGLTGQAAVHRNGSGRHVSG